MFNGSTPEFLAMLGYPCPDASDKPVSDGRWGAGWRAAPVGSGVAEAMVVSAPDR